MFKLCFLVIKGPKFFFLPRSLIDYEPALIEISSTENGD